jgi:hypothetical protein
MIRPVGSCPFRVLDALDGQRQGLRMLKLRDVLSRWEGSELSQVEAAELLGMSERTFRR